MYTIKKEEGCEVGETKDNALDVHEPSSPFLTYPGSPKEQTSAAAPVGHRPPMTVVVINGSSESCMTTASNEVSQRNWSLTSPPAAVSTGSIEESNSSWQRSHAGSINESLGTVPSPFSSFKLKPRNPFPLSPSQRGRGMGGARGRKRPAHSISIPAGSVSSADSSSRPPRPYNGKEEDVIDASSSKLESSSPGSEITPNDSSLSPDGLNMKSLSLRSPRRTIESTRCSPSVLGSQQSANRSMTHSFTMYVPSPAGSVVRDSNTATSSSSSLMAARTPCSSTKSSPRHVPLTVLSHGQMRTSSSKNPMVRPPLHEGGSSLLFSLHHDDNDSEDEHLGRPRKEMATLASSNSSLSSEEVDRKMSTFSSPGIRPTPMMYSSPSKTAASSPRTPLPRIMLTPRTPQSSGSRKAGLPMFPPSPSDDGIDALSLPQAHASTDDAMDNLLHEFKGQHRRFHSSTGYIQPLEPTKNPGMRRCYHDSSNSLAFSADGSKCETRDHLKRDDSWVSLRSGAESDIGDRPSLPKARELPTPLQDVSAPILHRCVTEKAPPPIVRFQEAGPTTTTAQSLVSTSRHNVFLREMMNVARASDAETGSLSDSGDEDSFVLTCPRSKKLSLDACDGNRRPKKRRDSCENDLFEHRGSYNSLTSALASASSLFGMDFYQEECASLSCKNKTPGSNGALGTKDNDESFAPLGLQRSVQSFGSIGLCLDGPASTNRTTIPSPSLKNKTHGSNGALSTKDNSDESFAPSLGLQRSAHSFASLGLCLDGPSASLEDHGRDLVTPPATRHVTFSPPPLAARPIPDEFVHATLKSQIKDSKTCVVDAEQSMLFTVAMRRTFE